MIKEIILLTLILHVSSMSAEALKSSIGNKLISETYTNDVNKKEEHTLTITGTAFKALETNLIKLGIKIETLDPKVNLSYQNNTRVSNKVSKFLKQNGVPDKNITTLNYQITPTYRSEFIQHNNTWIKIFDGYTVTNHIQLTLSKIKDLGKLIDVLVLSGPVQITNINFQFSDDLMKRTKDSLLEDAALDALERAKITAGALGVTVDDVKSISISDYSPPSSYSFPYNYDRSLVAAEATTFTPPTIYSGESNISINVYVTFVISNKK